MPPKKQGSGAAIKRPKRNLLPEPSQQQRNALTSMFASIQSKDSTLQQCNLCSEQVKSCLFNDHMATKCPNRIGLVEKKESVDDIVFLYSNKDPLVNIIHKKVNSPPSSIKTEAKSIKLETEQPAIQSILHDNQIKLESPDKTPIRSSSSDTVYTDEIEQFQRPVKGKNVGSEKSVNLSSSSSSSYALYTDEAENPYRPVKRKIIEEIELSDDDEDEEDAGDKQTDTLTTCLRSSARLKTQDSQEITGNEETKIKIKCIPNQAICTEDMEQKWTEIEKNENSNETWASAKENELLNTFIDDNQTTYFSPLKQSQPASSQATYESSYYLENFEKAINSVLAEESFACLLNAQDSNVIEQFSKLSTRSRNLYVRLFQRNFTWISKDKIVYDQISDDLSEYIKELFDASFIMDEDSIDSIEEIVYLLKLPKLKELAKNCHISNSSQSTKLKHEFIKHVINHFKSQKSLKFFVKNKEMSKNSTQSGGVSAGPTDTRKCQFMVQSKKILGKCYKLNKEIRSVFVRILMLYSLSHTHSNEPNSEKDSGQETLLQILMINMRQIKFVDYDIKLTIKIFEDRDALLRYQNSLEYENELHNLMTAKDFEQAFDMFNGRIYEFQKTILDPDINARDQKLPTYLRRFTSGSIYCKVLSNFADVCERMKEYNQANSIYEFLLDRQSTYGQASRARWFIRTAINYESHLKEPVKAFEAIMAGLSDKQTVRCAGRLGLFKRLVKMSETKRYLKIKELKSGFPSALVREQSAVQNAPVVEIEGTTLHTAEFIPGRKNVFIQNFETDFGVLGIPVSDDVSENENLTSSQVPASQSRKTPGSYGISVENVALNHYFTLGFNKGKHVETRVLTTLFGILFWDIIFDKTVDNVFVDKFQATPLDIQSDFFYQNRKKDIDLKLELLSNVPINFICELYAGNWDTYFGYECSLVSWSLFDSLEDLLGLVRCFESNQLMQLCRNFCLNYRYFRSGGPDLVIWSTESNECKFVEVKGPGDKLSEKQIVWLDFFMQIGVPCEVCYVKGRNSKKLY